MTGLIGQESLLHALMQTVRTNYETKRGARTILGLPNKVDAQLLYSGGRLSILTA